ncbi:phosphotransferase [Micromonospora aurantiaca]|uniref:phosphotransferase n=1 Tax=Micromonospora aurantiaca (nom. illeg.) TaxID=47850 RepID=UPI001476849B|nr:phosphotransferase [Micromonospora aurantiaca]
MLIARAGTAGVGIGRVVHRTDKAVVATGRRDGRPVIVKLLTTGDPYWVGRRHHELRMYELFAEQPPPVSVPKVLWADDRLTVLTQLSGQRLHNHRHLTGDISASTARLVLATLDTLTSWTPTPALPEPIDYHGRIDAEHAATLINDDDRRALHNLVDQLGPVRVTAHGDPLPANMLLDDAHCGLVDFEHAGRYLPGYDLALLRIVGAASPTLTAAVTDRVHRGGLTVAFVVNMVLLACRELRIHTSRRAAVPARRLAGLQHALLRARRDLHRLGR